MQRGSVLFKKGAAEGCVDDRLACSGPDGPEHAWKLELFSRATV